MNFLRNHWYDIGGIIGIPVLSLLILFHSNLTHYQLLMWLSLISLFAHQLEEYRIAGTFPGMINKIMFKSNIPDRFPLNSNTALLINVAVGWSIYILAALTGEHLIWLGLVSMIISLGNCIAHIFIFNFKGKTFYNAGLATCWLLFLPCIYFFFRIVIKENLASSTDYLIGIPLGILINVAGVVKPITWLADKNTPYLFEQRQLLPADRKAG